MNEQTRRSPLPGTLRERLRQGHFVMTAELVPPLSCDAGELLDKAAALKGLADAVNVTDGAGARAHMSALAGASLLIQAGSHETLLDDATRLAAAAADADVTVRLEVTPGVPHVFQAFQGLLDEADAALANAGAFLSAHLEQSAAAIATAG